MRGTNGAVTGVRWTGTLKPGEFTEFGLIAVNPAAPGELTWTAVQTYADGTKIEWSGARESRTPAPRTMIRAGESRSPLTGSTDIRP